MSPETLAIVMFFTLFVGLMLGHPLAFTLGMLAVVFGVIGWGGSADAVFALLANRAYGVMEEYVLVAVPLFIFMAQLLDASGIAERLFETMHIVMGRIRGGLGIAVIIACTIFAATAGVVGATEVSIGLLAIPALMKRQVQHPAHRRGHLRGRNARHPDPAEHHAGGLRQPDPALGRLALRRGLRPGLPALDALHRLHRHHLLAQARLRPGRDREPPHGRREARHVHTARSCRRSSWFSSCSAASCRASPPRPRRPAWAAPAPSCWPSATAGSPGR